MLRQASSAVSLRGRFFNKPNAFVRAAAAPLGETPRAVRSPACLTLSPRHEPQMFQNCFQPFPSDPPLSVQDFNQAVKRVIPLECTSFQIFVGFKFMFPSDRTSSRYFFRLSSLTHRSVPLSCIWKEFVFSFLDIMIPHILCKVNRFFKLPPCYFI